jgi:hypothetical protein
VLADHHYLKENNDPMSTATLSLGQIVIDSADAAGIAGFWSRLLDRPLVDGANQFFAVVPPAPDGTVPALMFLAVPEPRAGKNRLHLDLVSPDQPAAVDHAIALGATRLGDFEEYGTRWTTLADPEGNFFDIGIPHS